MNFIRIDHTVQGGSCMSSCDWELHEGSFTPPSPAGYFTSQELSAYGVMMMHHPAGYIDEWHCAPAPVLGTVLCGQVRIETHDLNSCVLHPGDQFLACDLEGKGHRMSEVNGGSYDLALVILEAVPPEHSLD